MITTSTTGQLVPDRKTPQQKDSDGGKFSVRNTVAEGEDDIDDLFFGKKPSKKPQFVIATRNWSIHP